MSPDADLKNKPESVETASDMVVADTMETISYHLLSVSRSIDMASIDEFARKLNSANRIFVMGAGRSGLVAKSFAMRLMHIGYQVYVVGEICKKLNVTLITVTSNKDSVLGRLSDLVVIVDSKYKLDHSKEYMERQLSGSHKSLTPMGTLFELTAAVFLDSFIARLMVEKGVDEAALKKRHTVLE